MDRHRVQAGDSLLSLAKNYYGTERYARFLADNNPHIADPARLRVGTIVKIPPAPARTSEPGQRGAPRRGGAQRSYTVQAGDSFYSIAKSTLGDATRWQELYALNKQLVQSDPKRLQVGQVLVLPD